MAFRLRLRSIPLGPDRAPLADWLEAQYPPAIVARDEEDVLMASDCARSLPAPEFPAGLEWINSHPLTLDDVRGKLVLLDFWTYG